MIENKEKLQQLIAYNKQLQKSKHDQLMANKYHSNGLDAIYVAIEKAKQNKSQKAQKKGSK